MAKCIYCKNKVEKKQPCSHCGANIGSLNGTVLSLPNPKAWAHVECQITNKYFIFYSVNKANLMENLSFALLHSMGALPYIIFELLKLIGIVNSRRYGYVDLKDINKIIVQEVEGKKKFLVPLASRLFLTTVKKL